MRLFAVPTPALAAGLMTLALAALAPGSAAAPDEAARVLRPGPHLFLDDYLVASSEGVRRVVQSPRRAGNRPVITGPEDKNFQPYVSVVRDPKSGRFRVWYGVPENASRSHLATMESADGIHWQRPHRVLEDPGPIQFGASVFDEGADFSNREQRYKFGWWYGGGLRVAGSPDGLSWRPLAEDVVLPHNHDINTIYKDAVRGRYLALVSSYNEGTTWSGKRRHTLQSTSKDLIHWDEPRPIITPDDRKDPGETQFYCVSGLLQRGDLLIGTLKVLRDDLPADPGGPAAGIGYTVLAWTRDGKTWTRDREPFLDRNPDPGTWDRAMTWIDCQLPVGDSLYFYYGGYRRGHKVERFTERQIGLARLRRDRYVARQADERHGLLRTPLLQLEGEKLTVNADALGGAVRVRVLDEAGLAIPGFDWRDAATMTGDELEHPLRFKGNFAALKGRPIRLEIDLHLARLYALNLQ